MSSATPKKIGENQYEIEADSNLGMKVPVRIYANEALLQKMLTDRTIMQAKTSHQFQELFHTVSFYLMDMKDMDSQ